MQEMQETWVQSLGQEDLLEEEMATCSMFLPGKFHGQRSLADYSSWGCKELHPTECTRTHTHAHSDSKQSGEFLCVCVLLRRV